MWSAKQYRTKAAPIDAFLYSKSKIALVGAVRNLCMTNTEAQKSYYGTTYFETVFLTRSVKAMSNAILVRDTTTILMANNINCYGEHCYLQSLDTGPIELLQ